MILYDCPTPDVANLIPDGKVDGLTVSDVKGANIVEICKGNTRKVVHVNCLWYRMGSQETAVPIEAQKPERALWQPAAIDHSIVM